MKYILSIILAFSIVSCKNSHKIKTNQLDRLVELMSGSFSSKKQSETDKDYFDIRLEMAPIWKHSSNGRWLYVEQAVSTHLNKPYRQRIYHVTQFSENQFSSAVYELPNPEKYIGGYADSNRFAQLKPEDLIARKGCAVFLKKVNETEYTGSTDTNKCLSSLRGASYATSEVTIQSDKITSWDRGFDQVDNHVWGAEKGAYVFDKVINE